MTFTILVQANLLTPVLVDLIELLDVPPSKYEEAKARYQAVGHWLDAEDSELAPYRPRIYPQGSFALGTAVKPLGKDDYDVDAVCLLHQSPHATTQQALKSRVGRRLKAHRTYERMLDPKGGRRRCWTLKYADGSRFHLDILPAVPDDCGRLLVCGVPYEIAKHAICITDRETWDYAREWPRSNPQGYVEWFKGRMSVAFSKRRRLLAGRVRAEVQDVPEYQVRTPLQRVIQLLKRHRDLRYNGDDDKPISIIITTLAAQAYSNEEDLGTALLQVVPQMRAGIECRNGVWWVQNPVDPAENFADKWNEVPRKRELFMEWLDAVEREHQLLLNAAAAGSLQDMGEQLVESYGQAGASSAVERFARRSGASRTFRPQRAALQFRVPHRHDPSWPVRQRNRVSVTGHAGRPGFRSFKFSSGSRAIRKGFSLKFKATTDVEPPFEVFWQVVNTGSEALANEGLRGEFYPGAWYDSLMREESTRYTGRHWVECFIVKEGVCVARSGEFVVRVA